MSTSSLGPAETTRWYSMYAVAKKIRTVATSQAGQIPTEEKSWANTSDWRERVTAELDKRGRGSRMQLVRHMRTRYSGFSSGHLTELIGPDEKPGQARWSRYVADINLYLWPDEFVEIAEPLRRVLRGMNLEDQTALAELVERMRKK